MVSIEKPGGTTAAQASGAAMPAWADALARKGLQMPDEESNALLVEGRYTKSGHPIAAIGPQVGYKFNAPFRIEFEDGWDRHSTGDFTTGGVSSPSSGHAEVRSAMINGVYDVHLLPRVRLSLGAGAGVGNSRVKFDNPFGAGTYSTRSGMKFMWQGIGGLTYEASHNFDLYIDYRYRNLRGSSNDDIAAPLGNHDLTEHVVMAGFRWYPSAGEERVAQEPPAPPPPPPPPPAPVKTFIVFFDFNKSNLTPEAVSVVGEAVKTAQQSRPCASL